MARQCLEAGLVDEVVVHVAPVLLGGGVRLFERARGGRPVRLQRTAVHEHGHLAALRHTVLREPTDARVDSPSADG